MMTVPINTPGQPPLLPPLYRPHPSRTPHIRHFNVLSNILTSDGPRRHVPYPHDSAETAR